MEFENCPTLSWNTDVCKDNCVTHMITGKPTKLTTYKYDVSMFALPAGFTIETDSGSVYHWGDTSYCAVLQNEKDLDESIVGFEVKKGRSNVDFVGLLTEETKEFSYSSEMNTPDPGKPVCEPPLEPQPPLPPTLTLTHKLPDSATKDIAYYYSELIIPAGFDTDGSEFVANGFSDGTLGMQITGDGERRIVFSVNGGNLIRKGDITEVEGASSYIAVPFKTELTYGFLL